MQGATRKLRGVQLWNRFFSIIHIRHFDEGKSLDGHQRAFRYLAIHMDESARQRARELANTAEFAHAQRQRKKRRASFVGLKNQMGCDACACED